MTFKDYDKKAFEPEHLQ